MPERTHLAASLATDRCRLRPAIMSPASSFQSAGSLAAWPLACINTSGAGSLSAVNATSRSISAFELHDTISHSRGLLLRCHDPGQRKQCTVGILEWSPPAIAVASLRAPLSLSSAASVAAPVQMQFVLRQAVVR